MSEPIRRGFLGTLLATVAGLLWPWGRGKAWPTMCVGVDPALPGGERQVSSYSFDAGTLSFGDSGVGLLLQRVYLEVFQSLHKRSDGSIVAARVDTILTLGRVVGPRPVVQAFLEKYGNVLNARTNSIRLDAENSSMMVPNLVIAGPARLITAGDMLLVEDLKLYGCGAPALFNQPFVSRSDADALQ